MITNNGYPERMGPLVWVNVFVGCICWFMSLLFGPRISLMNGCRGINSEMDQLINENIMDNINDYVE